MLPTSSSIEATLSAFNRSIAMRLMTPPQTQQMQQSQPQTRLQHPTQLTQPKQLVRRIQEQPEEIPPPPAPTTIRPTNSSSKQRREEEDNSAAATAEAKDVADDDEKSAHVLMPNSGGAKLTCRLCSKRGLKTRSRYGCVQCRLGFHVACFAVFHHPTKFATNPSPTVQDALDALDHMSASRPTTRRRANNSINSFDQLALPSLSDAQDALQDVEL